MSLADKIFVNMCKDILENGTSTEGEKVRPHWEDGTSAYTIKKIRCGQPLRSLKRVSGNYIKKNCHQNMYGRDALDLAEKIK